MDLLINFLVILSLWTEAFYRKKTFVRSIKHAIGSLCAIGRRTISNTIVFTGKEEKDWSAEYKLFSRSKWSPQHLFAPIVKQSLFLFKEQYVMAGDQPLKRFFEPQRAPSSQKEKIIPHQGLGLSKRKIETKHHFLLFL